MNADTIHRQIALLKRQLTLVKEIAAVDAEIARIRGDGASPQKPRLKIRLNKQQANRFVDLLTKSAGHRPRIVPMKVEDELAPMRFTPKKPRRRFPRKTGLTDFIRRMVAKRPQSVSWLAAMAKGKGFKSKNLPQVIRLMVGKSSDLVRSSEDRVSAKRRKAKR